MLTLPVLLVLREPSAPLLLAALERESVPCRACPAHEAADAVNSGWAELVVCERTPGWQALLSRIEEAGGAAVLWGEPARDAESKGIVPRDVEAVQDVAALRPALERAQARRQRRNALRSTEDLQGRVESAERVSRFAQSIATQLSLPGVIAEARARARDLCDADGASLLLVDSSTGELCFDQLPGGGGVLERVRLRPGEGIAGRVALSATPLLVREVHGPLDASLGMDGQTGFRTGSLIAVPLLLGGDVVGVLEAVRGADRPPFEPGHLRCLEQLAPHVSIAIHNAQMTAHLREAQAQVLAANAQLEQKVRERTAQIARGKREWERTFDAIEEPISLQEGFVIKRVNLAYARRVNLSITQVPGKTCHAVLAGRDSPCPGCPLLGASASPAAELSFPHETVFALSAFWMEGAGPGRPVVLHYRDVTGEKSLERKLRESERRVWRTRSTTRSPSSSPTFAPCGRAWRSSAVRPPTSRRRRARTWRRCARSSTRGWRWWPSHSRARAASRTSCAGCASSAACRWSAPRWCPWTARWAARCAQSWAHRRAACGSSSRRADRRASRRCTWTRRWATCCATRGRRWPQARASRCAPATRHTASCSR
jgi:GAF domain